MQKLFKFKSFILVVFVVVCTFLGRTISTFSISERNLVCMVGIDYDGVNYVVTAQIVSPSSGGASESSSADTFATVTDKATTVSEALNNIGSKTGHVLSLAHCNIVMLSKVALLHGPDSYLVNLTTSWLLPLNAVLVATDDAPESIMKLRVPTADVMTFYLQSRLLTEKRGLVTKTHINTFLTDYSSKSETVLVPVCRPIELSDDSILSSSKGNGKYVAPDLKSNFAVTKGGSIVTLDENAVGAVNLMRKQISEANLSIVYDDYKIEYQIVKSKTKMKYENNKVSAKLSADVAIKEIESVNFSEYLLSKEFKETFTKKLKQELENKLSDAFNLSKSSGSDFLMIKNLVWQSEGLSADLSHVLDSTQFKPEVEISLVKS